MPDWKPRVRRRLASLPIDGSHRSDLVEEIAADLDDRFAALVSAGRTPEDAARALDAEVDELPVEHLAAAMRQPAPSPVLGAAGMNPLSGVCHDLRCAVRALGRARLVSAVAILTLTVGVGASTAMFSVVNTVLIAPLPFPDPDRVVQIFPTFPITGGRGRRSRTRTSGTSATSIGRLPTSAPSPAAA